jgi:hypothetical protein
VCVCGASEGVWDTLVPVGWCLRCLPISKNTLSPYRWKFHCFLFLLMRRVSSMMVWFGIGGSFFFFPSYLLSLKNYSLTLLVFGISTSVLILLMSNFWSWPFCISFIYFQFYPSILFYQILYSPMWFSFFRFLFFFLILL